MEKSELRKIIKEIITKDFKTKPGDKNPNKRDIMVVCECDDENYDQDWCIGSLNITSGVADCSCCTINCAASIDSKI